MWTNHTLVISSIDFRLEVEAKSPEGLDWPA